jgi:hypothetical protein
MGEQGDLFGTALPGATGSGTALAGRRSVNDMQLIERVLGVAETQGYALVGPADRVYRRGARGEIAPAPGYEAEAVHQLLAGKHLTRGGQHQFTCGPYSGIGESVLVPRRTKDLARRWRHYKPLQSRGGNGKAGTERSDRDAVASGEQPCQAPLFGV